MLETVLGSNLVQLTLTFLLGALLYPILAKDKNDVFFVGVSLILCIGLAASFALDIGEVYRYGPTYKRAFFVFTDNIGCILVFLYLRALQFRRTWLAWALLSALILTGSRIAFILLIAAVVIYAYVDRSRIEQIVKTTMAGVAVGWVAYIFLLVAGDQIRPSFEKELEAVDQRISAVFGSVALVRGGGRCDALSDCVDSQVAKPAKQRLFSSLGGAWMIEQGGYAGKSYPNTREKFADLMVAANPYGINDRYDLSWLDWYRMGQPQNAFIHFGSGYGPIGLSVLLLFFGGIAVAGVMSLRRGKNITYAIFFIVIVLLNQTQSYLHSMSAILVVLGISACCVMLDTEWARRLLAQSRARFSPT